MGAIVRGFNLSSVNRNFWLSLNSALIIYLIVSYLLSKLCGLGWVSLLFGDFLHLLYGNDNT